MTCIDAGCRLSHCGECEAHPGDCGHGGHRHLAAIVYDRVDDPHGRRIGWAAPADDRDRFDGGSGYAGTGSGVVERRSPKPRSLEGLRESLTPWVFFSPRLEGQLEEAYRAEPMQVSLAVADLLRQAEGGGLGGELGGLLVHRLRQIRSGGS